MKKIVLFTIAILTGGLFLLAGVIPNQVNEEDYIYLDMGNSRVFTYRYGLAIYEKGTKLFYNVTPFDMYYREPATSVFQQFIEDLPQKNSIFNWNDNLKASQSNYNSFIKKGLRILSYFGLNSPSATFEKDNKTAQINVIKTSDKNLTFTLNSNDITNQSELEMSLSLNDEDIIIDDKFNIYIDESPTKVNAYTNINNKFGYTIKTYADLPYYLETKYIVISNPDRSGYFKLNVNSGVVYASIEAKRLNFKVDNNNPSFNMEIGDYLTEGMGYPSVSL